MTTSHDHLHTPITLLAPSFSGIPRHRRKSLASFNTVDEIDFHHDAENMLLSEMLVGAAYILATKALLTPQPRAARQKSAYRVPELQSHLWPIYISLCTV